MPAMLLENFPFFADKFIKTQTSRSHQNNSFGFFYFVQRAVKYRGKLIPGNMFFLFLLNCFKAFAKLRIRLILFLFDLFCGIVPYFHLVDGAMQNLDENNVNYFHKNMKASVFPISIYFVNYYGTLLNDTISDATVVSKAYAKRKMPLFNICWTWLSTITMFYIK